MEISVDAAKPENKDKWWELFLDGTKYSKEEYGAAMNWFYSSNQQKLMTEYADKFFENIDDIFKNKHRDYAEFFIQLLCPIKLGREQDKDRLEELYAAADEDRTHFKKYLKIAIEDLEDIISKRK